MRTFKRHGLTKHPLYGIWANMLTRCRNKKSDNYKWYGGKGIRVDQDWMKFPDFYKWAIGNGWEISYSLERLDNSKNYCPSNCTFIPRKHQTRNQSSNVWLEAFGRRQILSDWSRETKIPYEAIRQRIKNGWAHEKAVGLPISADNRLKRSIGKTSEWILKD